MLMKNSSTNNLPIPVVLVGMMGTGKTTFGKKLASKLSIPFFDLDHEIEKDIGHSVSWIFENAGEEEFRKLEKKKLSEILSKDGVFILALGGGAFIPEENRKIIKKKAYSVWLTASPETIYQRVSYRKDRPLLEKQGDKMNHIKDLMEKRDPIYAMADSKVITDKGSHKDIIDSIINEVSKA